MNKEMKEHEREIIQPVPRDVLMAELTDDRFFRYTNKGNNEIYVVDARNAPNVLREIGRLREVSFRQAGGGTGKELDLDDFDQGDNPYQQLIVWDPAARDIVGGYRFTCCWDAAKRSDGVPDIAMARLFRFSGQFIGDYMPYTIELGRSFVQPAYQPSRENRKSIYSLDNLWDGLGGLVVDYPQLKYFLGKVTMYQHFDTYARDLILYFMHRFFPDNDNLAAPYEPLPITTPREKLSEVFTGETFEENYRLLSHHVRARKENIPPLINSYMGLSPTMKTFGTAFNEDFGGVEETGIMVTIADIYDSKTRRHISTYQQKA